MDKFANPFISDPSLFLPHFTFLQISASIIGTGAHRQLLISFPTSPSPEVVGISIALPPSLFFDKFELDALLRATRAGSGNLSAYALHGELSVELGDWDAKEQV